MIERISEYMLQFQIREGAVEAKEKELYKYGYQLLLGRGSSFIFAAALSLILGTFFEMLLFLGVFILIRQYAGGYHMESPVKCICFSVLLVLGAGIFIKHTDFIQSSIFWRILWGAGIVAIVVLSPVGTKNKPLDALERKVYRKRTYIILGLELLVSIILGWYMDYTILITSISLAHIILGVSLAAGKCKEVFL